MPQGATVSSKLIFMANKKSAYTKRFEKTTLRPARNLLAVLTGKAPIPTDDDPHAVFASYSGGPGVVYYLPVLDCSCGYSTGRCEDWEAVGREFDEHMRLVRFRDH